MMAMLWSRASLTMDFCSLAQAVPPRISARRYFIRIEGRVGTYRELVNIFF
jgi:hypothetical protein